jgi:UDP-glucose 4-epimerase
MEASVPIMDVCLVTGGAGFLGSHLVKALVARKQTVRVLDNLSTGTLANLGRCARDIELIVGDVADLALVRELVEGVGVVFHFAAVPPDEFPVNPSGFPWQCDVGTAHVLIASRDLHVRRLIYASSTQVYGRAPESMSDQPVLRAETDAAAPVSLFAQAKLSGEQSCTAFTMHYGLETVRLRYSNIYGPRQSPSSPHARIVPDALTAMLSDQNPRHDGNELDSQDLIFVEDAIQATMLAADTTGVSSRVYNVGQGKMTTPREVVEILNDLLDTRLQAVPTGCPLEKEMQNTLDISRVRNELGFGPAMSLREGLSRCVRAVSMGLDVGPKRGTERFTEA